MTIRLTTAQGLSVLRIERPEVKNSLTLAQIADLRRALDEVAASAARCVLLMGSGGSFCAGRDLKEVDLEGEDTYSVMGSLINPLLQKLWNLPMPTVAAVQGPALGLGLGLALCCDLVWVAENALLGSPFRNFGGVTDSGGHYFLATRLGVHLAAELIFTGRLLSGSEAARLGLVNRAVPAPTLEAESLELCRQIAAGPTAAFRATKQILRELGSFEQVIELEARHMDTVLKGRDGREGISAFREKRAPRFTGG